MREIKFRAWDRLSNAIVELDGVLGDMGFKRTSSYNKYYELERVMQYTGLKDKNGKEIYEGDIVQRTSMAPGGIDFLGKVVYGECEYWLENERGAINLFTEIDELEVISNMYENPDLLGGNKNA